MKFNFYDERFYILLTVLIINKFIINKLCCEKDSYVATSNTVLISFACCLLFCIFVFACVFAIV